MENKEVKKNVCETCACKEFCKEREPAVVFCAEHISEAEKVAVTMDKDEVLEWLEEAKYNLANRSVLPAIYREAFETAIQLIKEADEAYKRGYIDGYVKKEIEEANERK